MEPKNDLTTRYNKNTYVKNKLKSEGYKFTMDGE